MDKIQLTNDVWIGKDQPPIVVAEIGLNHNGKLDTALEMIKTNFRHFEMLDRC